MLLTLPCCLPKDIKKYVEFFKRSEINFCIAGGYPVFCAGLTDCYRDVDIFVSDLNFNEQFFLAFDNKIEVVSYENDKFEEYDNVSELKKRFALTVRGYKIDFVLMDIPSQFKNNYLFSEYVTDRFDIDICRVSIINVDENYRIIFNSRFKVFVKYETEHHSNFSGCTMEYWREIATEKRFEKYENRLKKCYRMFYTVCAPPFNFERFMKFHQLNLEW